MAAPELPDVEDPAGESARPGLIARLAVDVSPLRESRPFRRLWVGQAVSHAGNAITMVAIPFQVYELTGSTLAVGLLALAALVPLLVVPLFGGAIADALDRRRVLLASEVALAAVAALLLANALLPEPRLWALYVLEGLGTAAWGFARPAMSAVTPRLVRPEQLTAAIALQSVYSNFALVAGPALAGVLIANIGGAKVLAVDAATYLLFVAALSSIRVPPAPAASGTASRIALGPVVRFVRREPAILATTLMFMAFNVGEGMLLVLLPVLARRSFGGGAETYGLLLSAFALAATVGAFVVGAVSWRYSLGRSIGVAQVLAGVTFGGLAFASSAPAAAIVLVVAGAFASPVTIWAQTIRMRRIPPELRGRTFGVLRTLMQSTPPLGGFTAGVLLAGGGGVDATVLAMVLVMAVPGALGLASGALEETAVAEADVVAIG